MTSLKSLNFDPCILNQFKYVFCVVLLVCCFFKVLKRFLKNYNKHILTDRPKLNEKIDLKLDLVKRMIAEKLHYFLLWFFKSKGENWTKTEVRLISPRIYFARFSFWIVYLRPFVSLWSNPGIIFETKSSILKHKIVVWRAKLTILVDRYPENLLL